MNEFAPGPEETDDANFVAPSTGEAEVVEDQQPDVERNEQLTERFFETPEMVELRQRAFETIEDLRESTPADKIRGDVPIERDAYKEEFLNRYLELGQAAIENVVSENRETAELELAAIAAQFQRDCGFEPNARASLQMFDYRFKREERPDLIKKLAELDAEVQRNWVKPSRTEAPIPQERIDHFLSGISVKEVEDPEWNGEMVNCQLDEEVALDEFKKLVQQAILPQLSGTGTVRVRGDALPAQYLEVLAEEMLRTDFPVIAVYDKASGEYRITYSEGGEYGEQLGQLIPDPEATHSS